MSELRSQDHFMVQESRLLYSLKQACNRILYWLWTVVLYLIMTFDNLYILLFLIVTGGLSLLLSGLTRCTRINIRGKLGLGERDDDWELPVSGIDLHFVHSRKQRLDRHFFRRKTYRQKRLVEPLPLPQKRKHRLSEIDLGMQPSANLLMRLPLELRREIYEYVLVSDSRNVHIAHESLPDQRTRLFSYACEHPWELHLPKDIRLRGFHHRPGELGPANCFPYPMPPNRLALVKVCRQVYLEAIDIIYSRRTFYFHHLAQPPYFMYSVLSQRLAQIRRIGLYYQTQFSQPCKRLSKAKHRQRQCLGCNFCHWLELIKRYMVGLRAVNLFIYLNLAGSNKPSFDDQWVQHLLALQHRTNVITDLEVKPCDWVALPKVESLSRFETQLKAELFRSSPVP